MNLPNWKHVAIGATAFVAVVSVGFLSSNTGPVQGASGTVTFLHDEPMCYSKITLHFGDFASNKSGWMLYSSDDTCIVERVVTTSEMVGRASISESIKAVKSK